jgi:hypothetical protein
MEAHCTAANSKTGRLVSPLTPGIALQSAALAASFTPYLTLRTAPKSEIRKTHGAIWATPATKTFVAYGDISHVLNGEMPYIQRCHLRRRSCSP